MPMVNATLHSISKDVSYTSLKLNVMFVVIIMPKSMESVISNQAQSTSAAFNLILMANAKNVPKDFSSILAINNVSISSSQDALKEILILV